MTWTVEIRHKLTLLLNEELSNPRRGAAVARAAGLAWIGEQGSETSFQRLSRLVLAASVAGKLDALVDAAKPAVSEATRVALQGLLVDPSADTLRSEADAPTMREEDDTIQAPAVPAAEEDRTTDETDVGDDDEEDPPLAAVEHEGAAPRPPGTPAQAPPTEGATSWFVRRVHVGAPTTTSPGAELRFTVTLTTADPASVATAPADATPYAGGPVPLEVELWLEEGWPADGQDLHRVISVGAADAETRVDFAVVAPRPLADGVDATVRFFVRGYEVGRARAFVINREAEDVQPRPSTPGAVVVPDTILD
jgi:hypothetical protein